MRVLQIIDNISMDAGVASAVMNIYRHIDRRRIQFDFLVCNKALHRGKNFEEEILSLGGQVFYCGSPLSVRTFFSSQKYIKHFFIKNKGIYDIVHLHTPTIAEFTLKYAKRYGITNRITHSHSTMTSLNRVKILINTLLIKRLKKYTTHYWACSTEAAEFLYGKEFCRANNIELMKNGVETQRFTYNQYEAQKICKNYCLEDAIIISHISNFSPIKNHDFLINVITEIKKVKPNMRFLFIGDGPTKNKFEQLVKRNDLCDICIFVGRTDKVEHYLMVSDAVILPSIREGLPVTIIEAQAAGVPCLISESITREANVGNVQYLKLEAKEWINNLLKVSKLEMSRRVGSAISFTKSSFNIEKEAKRIECVYVNIVSKGTCNCERKNKKT